MMAINALEKRISREMDEGSFRSRMKAASPTTMTPREDRIEMAKIDFDEPGARRLKKRCGLVRSIRRTARSWRSEFPGTDGKERECKIKCAFALS
jgi:hypothetical protein